MEWRKREKAKRERQRRKLNINIFDGDRRGNGDRNYEYLLGIKLVEIERVRTSGKTNTWVVGLGGY